MDRLLAMIAVLMMIAFVSVVVGFVRELDLAIVIIVVVLIAIYDFYRTFKRQGGKR